MTGNVSRKTGLGPFSWSLVAESLARPYRVTFPMTLLVALVPLYILVPAFWPPPARHLPELTLDRWLPLMPAWSLIYGALYLFLILLPVVIVREQEHIDRTVFAYLFVWLTAFAFFFFLYPTAAPRPHTVVAYGFGGWGLRALYSADPPFNCFPSLHVAHSFVSALTCGRLHRGLGVVSLGGATLVALSTLFTKQHYVLDVVAGVCLALVAYVIFIRSYPPGRVPEFDRHVAPALAVGVLALVGLGVAGSWIVYLWSGETRFEFGP